MMTLIDTHNLLCQQEKTPCIVLILIVSQRVCKSASPHMLLWTQCHTPNTFPGNNLLKVIIYSVSSKLSPHPFSNSLHSSWRKIHLRCVSDGWDVTVFWNKFQCRRREVIVSHLLPDTVGVFECRALPTPPAVNMELNWIFPLEKTKHWHQAR